MRQPVFRRALAMAGLAGAVLILISAFGMTNLIYRSPAKAKSARSAACDCEPTDREGPVWENAECLAASRSDSVLGFWYVTLTGLGVAGVFIGSSFGHRRNVRVYRPYEEKLLAEGLVERKAILDYHAQYDWGNYAAVTIGMVLLAINLIVVENQSLTRAESLIQAIGVGVMVVAAVCLSLADLVHRNTQSPIIPDGKRFQLISFSVRFGTVGALSMLIAVLFFVCLIDSNITAACCLTLIGVLTYVYIVRRVPKRALFEAYKVEDRERWIEADPRFGNRQQREFADDEKYIPSTRRSQGEKRVTAPVEPAARE